MDSWYVVLSSSRGHQPTATPDHSFSPTATEKKEYRSDIYTCVYCNVCEMDQRTLQRTTFSLRSDGESDMEGADVFRGGPTFLCCAQKNAREEP